MAGRARFQALKDLLESQGREYYDGLIADSDPIASILDYLCARVESGTTTKALCRELTEPLGYELTVDRLTRFLRELFGDETVASRLAEARSRASHSYAEEALELVDKPAYDSVSVQQARARAAQRNWMAERYNPQAFGQSKGVTVSVSIASLHLDALRSRHQEVTVASTSSVGNTLTTGVDGTQLLEIAPVSHHEG